MRKREMYICTLVLLVMFSVTMEAVDKDKMEWWKQSKFGMFIHWGLYAIPAGVYNGNEIDQVGEWIMFNEDIPVNEYEKFAYEFNPVSFNAAEWVSTAKYAGMKYIVITSKHHDGFCLWNSKTSDYDVVDKTPYKKDILKQLAEECKKQDIKLCFYYSIWDWHHPKANKDHFEEYYKDYMVPQIKELLTEYGDIGIMWFDGEWIEEWTEDKGIELYNKIISLQPNTIVNNRIGTGRSGMEGLTRENTFAADYDTPEQEIPDVMVNDRSWETCMTMNGTWGYKTNDNNWKSAEDLINNLVNVVGKGGNFLLNVGPKADGLFPVESVEILNIIGEWMAINKEAIYSTKPYRKFKENESIRYTSSLDNKFLYVIVSGVTTNKIDLNEINIEEGSKIKLLGYEGEIVTERKSDNITIYLPEIKNEYSAIENILVLKIKQTEYVKTPTINISENNNSQKIASINLDKNGVEFKYSLDGSTPDMQSKTYYKPLTFDESVILKVKAFKTDFAKSLTASIIIDLPKDSINGIIYKYYEGSNWTKIPDFSQIESKYNGQINNFNIEEIKKREDQYAIKFNTQLKIPKAGLYKFYIESDDGSILILDNKSVINNDGSHSVTKKDKEIYLTAGYHNMELQYFDDCEGEVLNLLFSSKEIPKQKIPLSFFYLKNQ